MSERVSYLRQRLVAARQARRDYPNRSPAVEYCLICDEFVVDEELDCAMDHYESIIGESHSGAHISAWIDCIDHVVRGRDADSDADSF